MPGIGGALSTVIVEFFANTRKLDDGIKKSNRQTSELKGSLKEVQGVIHGMFRTLAAYFGTRALYRSIKDTIKGTNELIQTAKGVGFSATEYERLTFALEQVGVSAESARIGLGDLQKRLGNPNFAKFYRAIGLTQRQLLTQTPAQQLDTVIEALRKVPDRLLVTRSGGVLEEQSGKDFAKVVRQYKDYARARADYDRLASHLGIREQKRFTELNYQAKLLSKNWELVKRKVVGDAAPQILEAMERLADSGALDRIAEALALIATNAGNATSAFFEFLDSIQTKSEKNTTAYVDWLAHGDPTDFERAAAEKAKMDAQFAKGPIGNTTYNIDQIFHGVNDRDMPRRAGNEVRKVLDPITREPAP